MKDVLHDRVSGMTLAQLRSSIRKLKKYSHLGLYIVADDVADSSRREMFDVELWGPTLKWKKKMKIEWVLDNAE